MFSPAKFCSGLFLIAIFRVRIGCNFAMSYHPQIALFVMAMFSAVTVPAKAWNIPRIVINTIRTHPSLRNEVHQIQTLNSAHSLCYADGRIRGKLRPRMNPTEESIRGNLLSASEPAFECPAESQY
jgi:hypothetical protein